MDNDNSAYKDRPVIQTESSAGPIIPEPSKNQQEICKACQECCKWITFTVNLHRHKVGINKEFYEARGCTVKVKRLNKNRTEMIIMVPSPCQHLDKDRGCTIYVSRPWICRMYDGRTDKTMIDKCQL